MTNELRERGQAKTLRSLIAVQVVIAALALVVLIFLGIRIRPLVGAKNQLEKEIKRDKAEIAVLEIKLTSRRRELESAEQNLREATEKIQQGSSSQSILQREIGSQGKFSIKPVQIKDEYVIVLGSYKRLGGAMQEVNNFKTLTGEDVHLLYSVGDYYVPVVGLIESRRGAEDKLEKIHSRVPDAFVSTTGAFLYEIDTANSKDKQGGDAQKSGKVPGKVPGDS
jgi:hypothetical protein